MLPDLDPCGCRVMLKAAHRRPVTCCSVGSPDMLFNRMSAFQTLVSVAIWLLQVHAAYVSVSARFDLLALSRA